MNLSKQTKAQLIAHIKDVHETEERQQLLFILFILLFFTASIGFAFWLSHDANTRWYHEVIPPLFFIIILLCLY